MQIRLDLSIYLCLGKVHSDFILQDFLDIFSYIIIPLMDCFSQKQNPSYSYEHRNLCEGEDDGDSSYLVTEEQGVSGCTGRYGARSPEALQAPSSTPKSHIIIWFYLLIWYCLLPLWEALVLSLVTWVFSKYILVYLFKTIVCTLRVRGYCYSSWNCVAVCARCGEGLRSQWLPHRPPAPEEALGQGWCRSAQDRACCLQPSTIPSSCHGRAHVLQRCLARGGKWALQAPPAWLWQSWHSQKEALIDELVCDDSSVFTHMYRHSLCCFVMGEGG